LVYADHRQVRFIAADILREVMGIRALPEQAVIANNLLNIMQNALIGVS